MVDSLEFRELLIEKGFTGLTIQYGNGKYIPSNLNESESKNFKFNCFNLKPSIAEDFDRSDLIIGHAGKKKRLIIQKKK